MLLSWSSPTVVPVLLRPVVSMLASPSLTLSSVSPMRRWFGSSTPSSSIEIRDRAHFNAEVLDSDKPVVIIFYASWCRPCHILEPVLESIHKDYQQTVKMVRVRIDAEGSQQLAMEPPFQVPGVPAGFLVHRRKVHDRFVGAIPEPQVRRFFDHAQQLAAT